MVFVPVIADNQTSIGGDSGSIDLLSSSLVVVADTVTPTPEVTTVGTTELTTEPTTIPLISRFQLILLL